MTFWAHLQIFSVLLMISPGLAQNENLSRGILIISRPVESTIRLEGAYTFIGRTPFTISQNLSGAYTLSALMQGYERKQIQLDLAGEPFRKITIDLHPLSRFKATYRSLLLPGWGQRYKGATGRGLLFTGLAFGAGVGTLVTHLNYRSHVDDAEQAQREYESMKRNFVEAQAALNSWQAAHRQSVEAYDRRRRSLRITAALWTLNILDALLLPPGPGRAQEKEAAISSRLGFENSKIELKIFF